MKMLPRMNFRLLCELIQVLKNSIINKHKTVETFKYRKQAYFKT